ncbi:MAG: hypothetical protein Q9198_001817, partial [Flavoplaca austrocitrina]
MPSEDKTSAANISAPLGTASNHNEAVNELEKPMAALSVDAKDFLSKAMPMSKDSTELEKISDQERVKESPKKSMGQVVNEMLKETKVGQAKDLHSMVMFNLKDTRDEGDPKWYSIVGIDNDQRMVNMYNEVVKRQEYPGNLDVPMHAYCGDLMPAFPSRKAPKLTDQALVEALDHEGFDLVVVMLAMDCFEILPLSAHDRVKQILYNLDALVKRLRDGGTLLILDFQKATTQTNVGLNGLKEGHKPNGYHSDTLVDALKHLSMDVDVIDGLRFQW